MSFYFRVKRKRDKACCKDEHGFWCWFWEFVHGWQGGDTFADSGPNSDN